MQCRKCMPSTDCKQRRIVSTLAITSTLISGTGHPLCFGTAAKRHSTALRHVDRATECTQSDSPACNGGHTGRRNARVLPDPVLAAPRTSRPAKACGIAARCTAVSVVNFAAASPACCASAEMLSAWGVTLLNMPLWQRLGIAFCIPSGSTHQMRLTTKHWQDVHDLTSDTRPACVPAQFGCRLCRRSIDSQCCYVHMTTRACVWLESGSSANSFACA